MPREPTSVAVRSRSHGRPWLAIAVALIAVLVAAACGSRLPDDVLAEIDNARLAGTRDTGPSGTDAGPRDEAVAVDDGPSEVGPGADSPSGAVNPGEQVTDAGPSPDGGPDSPTAPCAGGASDTGVTADEIRVASIVTASGPLPGATEGAFRGAAAYLAKVNAEGGVCGRQIRLVRGDDGLDPQRARGEFLRLEPNSFAFVGSFAVADSGYIDLIESTGVPYVATAVDPAGRHLPNVVPVVEQGVGHTGVFEYYRQNYPDVQKVGVMYADIGGVRENVPGFIEGWRRAGFDVVYNAPGGATQIDFTGDIINMMNRDVDLIYLFAFEVSMHVRLARQMRQQQWDPPVKVSNIGYNSELVDLLGPIANGWTAHMNHLPMLNPDEPGRSAELAEFVTWHERLFPGTPIDLFPVTAWADAARFVDALREAGGEPTREQIIALVSGVAESNGGGIWAPMSPANRQGATCFVIARVANQTWTREHPSSGFDCDLGEPYRF